MSEQLSENSEFTYRGGRRITFNEPASRPFGVGADPEGGVADVHQIPELSFEEPREHIGAIEDTSEDRSEPATGSAPVENTTEPTPEPEPETRHVNVVTTLNGESPITEDKFLAQQAALLVNRKAVPNGVRLDGGRKIVSVVIDTTKPRAQIAATSTTPEANIVPAESRKEMRRREKQQRKAAGAPEDNPTPRRAMEPDEDGAIDADIIDDGSKDDTVNGSDHTTNKRGDDMSGTLETTHGTAELVPSEPATVPSPKYRLEDPEQIEFGSLSYEDAVNELHDILPNGRYLFPMIELEPDVPEPKFRDLQKVPVLPDNPIQFFKMTAEERTKLAEEHTAEAKKKAEYDAAVAAVARFNADATYTNAAADARNRLMEQDAELMTWDPTTKSYLGVEQITHSSLHPEVSELVGQRVFDDLPPQTSMGLKKSLAAHAVVAGTGALSEMATKQIEPNHGGIHDLETPDNPEQAMHLFAPNLVAYNINQALHEAVPVAVDKGYNATILGTGDQETEAALETIGIKPAFHLPTGELLVDGWEITRAAARAQAIRNGVIQVNRGPKTGQLELETNDQAHLAELATTIVEDIGEMTEEKAMQLQKLAGTILGVHWMPKELNMGLGEDLDGDINKPSVMERGSDFELEMVIHHGGKFWIMGGNSELKSSTGNSGLEEGKKVQMWFRANATRVDRNASVPALTSINDGGVFVNPLVQRGVGIASGDKTVTVYNAIQALQWQTNPARVGIAGEVLDAQYAPETERFRILDPRYRQALESGDSGADQEQPAISA